MKGIFNVNNPRSWLIYDCKQSRNYLPLFLACIFSSPPLILNFKFYRRIVDLQCCVNFCYTAKWLSYIYIYILFHSLFHYGLSQDIEYFIAQFPVLFIDSAYTSLYLLIPNSHSIPLPPSFPLATTSLFSVIIYSAMKIMK